MVVLGPFGIPLQQKHFFLLKIINFHALPIEGNAGITATKIPFMLNWA